MVEISDNPILTRNFPRLLVELIKSLKNETPIKLVGIIYAFKLDKVNLFLVSVLQADQFLPILVDQIQFDRCCYFCKQTNAT